MYNACSGQLVVIIMCKVFLHRLDHTQPRTCMCVLTNMYMFVTTHTQVSLHSQHASLDLFLSQLQGLTTVIHTYTCMYKMHKSHTFHFHFTCYYSWFDWRRNSRRPKCSKNDVHVAHSGCLMCIRMYVTKTGATNYSRLC